MNFRLFAFAALLIGSVSMYSCIDPDQTQEVLLQRDKEAIEKYLQENSIASVKEYQEPIEGFYMFWQVSTQQERNALLRGDTVRVNYTGRLLNNKIFDTSLEQVARDNNIFNSARNYQPLRFPVGYGLTISGFEFAISMMHPGEKATVIFPSRLGYGNQANGEIPANSPLIFELELLEVKKGPNLNP
ncbi:FKBP-type peptidyl-prolyl cis-trans isomerase FklB [Algoriphagus aquaeductus]|uniref:Peptidyl-prolyl cis-trans isomerase n=1 Tax=Algoriphagus aquaeductus TaxID=475299 RepID=A0A326S817_9BACT|nr:FKBP-type peptidyl-prolyl cis-trans isomerase [Algoriphagus aquaeductus]PZV86147.1 FKBP-type peptidyl-prolyl cis-trans isomerase FklB [Algoriphagus aquaeductus]